MNVQSSSLKFFPSALSVSSNDSFISHFIECLRAVFVVIGDAFKSLLAWNTNIRVSAISATEIQERPPEATQSSAVKLSAQESVSFILPNTPLLLSAIGLLGTIIYKTVGPDISQHSPICPAKIPLPPFIPLCHCEKVENISSFTESISKAFPSIAVESILPTFTLLQSANSVCKFVVDNSSALVPYFFSKLRVPSKEFIAQIVPVIAMPSSPVCPFDFSPTAHLMRVAVECIESHASALKYGFIVTTCVGVIYWKCHQIWDLKNPTSTELSALPTADPAIEAIKIEPNEEPQNAAGVSPKNEKLPSSVPPKDLTSEEKLTEFFKSIKLNERTQNETIFWKNVLTKLFSSLTARQMSIVSEEALFWSLIYDRDFVKVAANFLSAECLQVLAEKASIQTKYQPYICKLLLNLEPVDVHVKANYFSFAAKLKVYESYWCPLFDVMHFNHLSNKLKTNKVSASTVHKKITPQLPVQNNSPPQVSAPLVDSELDLEKFVEIYFLNENLSSLDSNSAVSDPVKVSAFFSYLQKMNDESIAIIMQKLGDDRKCLSFLWGYFKHKTHECDYAIRARMLKAILVSISDSQLINSINAETILEIISDKERGFAAVAAEALLNKQLDTLVFLIPLEKMAKLFPLIENLGNPSSEEEKILIAEKLHAIESMYLDNEELTSLIAQKKSELESFHF